jgi:Fic family protein
MDVKLKIDSKILKLIAELDEFKGSWAAAQLLGPDRLLTLRQVATIESIGSSTRIEGAKLSDQEVEKLLLGIKTFSFRSRDEQEVAGYAEAMELVFTSFKELDLTENHIKQLHSVLLKFSQKDERHRGEYKKFPNHVEAFDSEGKSLGVVFETAKPFDTPKRMRELVEWTNKAFEEKEIHSLLVVAVFVVHFLAVHPFQDGNGRLSRVLTTLLLLRCGYSYVPYSSFERIIEANKKQYYLALRRAQSTLKNGDTKLSHWIHFFLESMVKQKVHLEEKLKKEMLIGALPETSSQILEFIRDHGKATVAQIVAATGKNRNTVKAHLQRLVKEKRLNQNGRGKGTWYGNLL